MNQQTNSDLVSGEIKHTALPWHVTPNTCVSVEIRGADRKPVAELWLHEDTKANAAFIVRACNAHDSLVKALQEANFKLQAMQVDYSGPAAQSIYVLRERISAALRKAGVK